jgi:hypothetical protein
MKTKLLVSLGLLFSAALVTVSPAQTLVQGAAGNGSDAYGNPVQIGGVDATGKVRPLRVEDDGKLVAAGALDRTTAAAPFSVRFSNGTQFINVAREDGNLATAASELVAIDGKLPTLENGRFPIADRDTVEQAAVSLSATGVLFTQDMSGLRTAVVQVTAIGTATVTFEVSNNNTDWVTVAGYAPGDTGSAGASTTLTAVGARRIGVSERWFRARVSSWTSGTVTANALYRSEPTRTYGINIGGGTTAITQAVTTTAGASSPSSVNAPATPATNQISGTNIGFTAIHASNSSSSWRYLKLFNASSVTLGTTAATLNFGIPPGGTLQLSFPIHLRFSSGFFWAVTGGASPTDNTAIAANEVLVNFLR